MEWRRIVTDICDRFWPDADFPHEAGWLSHPAGAFVACCLIYDPILVDPELITPFISAPVRLNYDPEGDGNPDLAYWEAKARYLESALTAAVSERRTIDPKTSDEIVYQADVRAELARHRQVASNRKRWPKGVWFVPVHQDLSSADWRKLEQSVLPGMRLKSGDTFLRDRIRSLASAGATVGEIAARLGIDPSTVRRNLPRSRSTS